MTAIRFFETLRRYGADVLLLALGVTLAVALLKKVLPKRIQGKICLFLPFAVGILFYAVYRMIVVRSIAPLTSDFQVTLEGGLGCGSAATVYYLLYEQFFRGKKTPVLAPLLEGIVAPEQVEEAAALLAEGIGKSDEERAALIGETLEAYAMPEVTEEERAACALLIDRVLKALQTA